MLEELSRDLGKEDYLLVIGGTNNMEYSDSRDFMNDVHNLISISQHTNLVLVTVPWQYDRAGLYIEIAGVNGVLKMLLLNIQM